MRLVRLAMIVCIVLMGTAALQAQIAHSPGCDPCGCQTCAGCDAGCDTPCAAGCGCETCTGTCNGNCGVLGCLSTKLHHAVGGLLGGGAGCDARHQIYRAALRRSTFDKKIHLPIAYYSHVLPIYRHDRCCCGGVTPSAGCPHCGPQPTVGEEVIEMHDVQPSVPVEPTPAAAPAKEARGRQWLEHSVSRTHSAAPQQTLKRPNQDRVAQKPASKGTTLRNFLGLGKKPQQTDSQVRQVSAVQIRVTSESANPLR